LGSYVHQRTLLERHARANRENVWNGRPISLIVLAEPLEVLDGTPVSLIELIPPVHQRVYRMGLEHLGVVVGEDVDEFSRCIGPRELVSSSRVPTSSRTTSCSRTSPT
jgi:predicted metalloenzyme YecM